MSGEDTARLVELAQQWMLDDPDPEACAELTELVRGCEAPVGVDTGADASTDGIAELADRFACRLAFGTAGLRGRVGAGPNRMNSKVVMQTSAGLANFLLARAHTGTDSTPAAGHSSTHQPSVVIGFDARLKSEQFAHDAATVLAGAGIRVTLLDGPVPTPITAFAVRYLGVSAGVMITASHNPPEDNGYKVYLGGADAGSQIAPPVDAEIAKLIEQAATLPLSSIPRSETYAHAGGEVVEAYVQATAHTTVDPSARLKCVYTAMHGVGFEVTKRVFAEAGLPRLISVPEQQAPDGRFPTVAFPNPEEPGALDLATALAAREHADLIIAHDPDADRLAIALPSRSDDRSRGRQSNGYTQLTGNQLGLLLGWECAERFARSKQSTGAEAEGEIGVNATPAATSATLAATVVSSPALSAVAEAYGLDFVQTLSGFKWVSRVPNLIFGFEEALGYLVNPDVIRDKDGISAAVMLTEIAVRLHVEGKTLWDRLDEASERFGHFSSDQVTLRLGHADEVEQLSARIRSRPPVAFGGVGVAAFTDFLDQSSGSDGSNDSRYGGMPVAANVLRFDLEDGSRVMIRPSGTEPKLKIYLDASCTTGSVPERRADARARVATLREAVEALVTELLKH